MKPRDVRRSHVDDVEIRARGGEFKESRLEGSGERSLSRTRYRLDPNRSRCRNTGTDTTVLPAMIPVGESTARTLQPLRASRVSLTKLLCMWKRQLTNVN